MCFSRSSMSENVFPQTPQFTLTSASFAGSSVSGSGSSMSFSLLDEVSSNDFEIISIRFTLDFLEILGELLRDTTPSSDKTRDGSAKAKSSSGSKKRRKSRRSSPRNSKKSKVNLMEMISKSFEETSSSKENDIDDPEPDEP